MVGKKADLKAVTRVYWMAALLVAWLAGMLVVLMAGWMAWLLVGWMVASLGSSKVVQKAVQKDCLKVVP
jgi:fatty acid desaturase